MFTLKNNVVRILSLLMSLLGYALCLVSCSGGPGITGGGGIVGTGKPVVASGVVTGFGSVIVNSVEFSRSAEPGVPAKPIVFAFENLSSAGEDLLRPGMMVTVQGSYDSTSRKGGYTRIVHSPELRGPLDNGSVNASAGSLTVLGRPVQVGTATIFDGISDILELQTRQNQGLELEVNGFLDAAGSVQASRIALKSSAFTSGTVQLKGAVTSATQTSFSMGSLTVSTNGATFEGLTAADLTIAGLVVEVRGVINGSVISSARIERKTAASGAQPGAMIDLKGIAAGSPVAGVFTVSGPDGPLVVHSSAAVFFRGGAPSDVSIVVAGAQLELEGMVLADGSFEARKVSLETEKTVRLEGDLSAMNPVTASLTLNGVTLSTIPNTSYRDNRTAPVPVLRFSDLATGDHLQVYGFQDGTGRVIAAQVERFNPAPDNILQGPVNAIQTATSQLTILGVTVSAQPGASLSKGSVLFANFASFSSQVSPGSTLVKAKGSSSGSSFSASSLEIQQ